MSGGKEVGESSGGNDIKNMPPHVKNTLDELKKEMYELRTKCHLITTQVRAYENRKENLQKAGELLKKEWVRNLKGVGDEQKVKDITDNFDQKFKELHHEFAREEHRRQDLIKQYNELRVAHDDKVKLIDSLNNDHVDV